MAKEWANDGRNRANWEFCGVDGEGGNIPDRNLLFGDIHSYLLLRAGEQTVENPHGLSYQECFDFLCELPHNRIYVAYFFDYDVTMMIRQLPEERARRLFNQAVRDIRGRRLPVEIDHKWEIDYTPHKEFRIRKADASQWTIINDVGQFFQSSFLATIGKWEIGTEQERAFIAKGKSMRADFADMDEEIRAYNAMECLHLEQLMSNFRGVCWEVGYVPKKWQGPGYLASAMLDYHKVPRREAIPILKNDSFRRLANAAYYGGRFETTAAGPIPGPVYQYDINSAYPAALRKLPCLIHGSWKRSGDRPPDGSLWFGTVHFHHREARYLFNLPVRRKDGSIYYPREGSGVYWSPELDAAERAGTEFDCSETWVHEGSCDCRWFDFIDDYYLQRLRLGKTTKGFVLKLAGNSIYGKIAQSIGYAPYANPVWAGLITAHCRASIVEAYSKSPQDCYMIATDGIFSAVPLQLPISDKLGEWDETIHPDGMFIVQPGIYFMSDGEVKTRGVERGRIYNMRADFQAAWDKYVASQGLDHTVSVAVDNFITGPQALARNKWSLAGTWEHTTRDISFDWGMKRVRAIARTEGGIMRTLPHFGGPEVMSVPYGRMIGSGIQMLPAWESRYTDIGLQEAERMAGQPDWVDPLL